MKHYTVRLRPRGVLHAVPERGPFYTNCNKDAAGSMLIDQPVTCKRCLASIEAQQRKQ